MEIGIWVCLCRPQVAAKPNNSRMMLIMKTVHDSKIAGTVGFSLLMHDTDKDTQKAAEQEGVLVESQTSIHQSTQKQLHAAVSFWSCQLRML